MKWKNVIIAITDIETKVEDMIIGIIGIITVNKMIKRIRKYIKTTIDKCLFLIKI